MNPQKIVPHLWYDTQALEAAQFYISIFPNSKINNTTILNGTPSGDCQIVSFNLNGYEINAISAGPYFKLNPSISFMVNFDPSKDKNAVQNIQTTWDALQEGGKILMPFQKYDFSEKYGWVQDKYGLSWQLILSDPAGDEKPFIIPSFLFVGDVCGKAKQATDFYMSVFEDSQRGLLVNYPSEMTSEKSENIMYTDFKLQNQWFVAMDSSDNHEFKFNEAFSLMIKCKTQEEIDYFWNKLSFYSESEQCGWVKDMFGVSWQVVYDQMDTLLATKDSDKLNVITQSFLTMKKFDIQKLNKAFETNIPNITVSAVIKAPIEKVWECYTNVKHVVNWNNASPDWHTPKAVNDLKIEGKFTYRMEAKDGSEGFDFEGTYTNIQNLELIEYKMDDGREVKIQFVKQKNGTQVIVNFDAEMENSLQLQQQGWQAILNNFSAYVCNHFPLN